MRVLIVGGGVAGLSLAVALQRKGVSAEVIERQADQDQEGAGLYLPGNATRAVSQLGLGDKLRKRSFPITSQRFLNHLGSELSSIKTAKSWKECGECLSLRRGTFHELLTTAYYGKVIWGSISRLEQSHSKTLVTFSDGRIENYDVVVGADGIRSRVRQLEFPEVIPSYVGNVCWRYVTENNAGIDNWTVMIGRGRTLLAIPVSAREVYVYADLNVAEHAVGDLNTRSRLTSVFAGFEGPVMPLLRSPYSAVNIHFGKIEQVNASAWVNGRGVLIGDAAHASSPSMAEGVGMAVEDALVLADELTSGPDIDEALKAYESKRRPRVSWVQEQCQARDKMRTMPDFIRNPALKFFGPALYRRNYAPLTLPL